MLEGEDWYWDETRAARPSLADGARCARSCRSRTPRRSAGASASPGRRRRWSWPAPRARPRSRWAPISIARGRDADRAGGRRRRADPHLLHGLQRAQAARSRRRAGPSTAIAAACRSARPPRSSSSRTPSTAGRGAARVHARLAGYGMTTDAHHVTAPHPEGEGMIHAMRLALDAAGLAARRGRLRQRPRHRHAAERPRRGAGARAASSARAACWSAPPSRWSATPWRRRAAWRRPPRSWRSSTGCCRRPRTWSTVDPEVPFDCLPGVARPADVDRRAVELVRLRRPERQPDLPEAPSWARAAEASRATPMRRRGRDHRVGTVNASTVGGRDALAGALALGRSAIGPVRAFDAAAMSSRLAAEVDEATLASLVDRDAARRLSRICRLAPRGLPARGARRGRRGRARARHRGRHRARRLHLEPRLRRRASCAAARPASRR